MSEYRYDLFLSHNARQKAWVREFAHRLRHAGLTVFFDEDSVAPGEDVIAAIERGIQQSRRILLVISPAALASLWVALETSLTLYADPTASAGKMIPIIIEPVEPASLRLSLRRLNILDFTDPATRDDRFYYLTRFLGLSRDAISPPEWPGTPAKAPQAPEPRIVHTLPPAPHFVGRSAEMEAIQAWWRDARPGVLSIIGIGGAGKTALTTRFLNDVLAGTSQATKVFVWSFYEDRDPEQFFEMLFEYVTGLPRPKAKATSWLFLLKDSLARAGRVLLVLDGLEVVQRAESVHVGRGHVLGELEDALLREFLRRIAAGAGSTKALITTRFPVVDLEQWENQGYHALHLDNLDNESALALLHSHGIRGTAEQLRELVQRYGAHALTLDHLGSLLSRYYDGDAQRAADLNPAEDLGGAKQTHKLRSIFQAYEHSLPPEELAVLSRLCVFRVGVPVDLFFSVFKGRSPAAIHGGSLSNAQIRAILHSLTEQHLVLKEGPDRFTVHPAVRDYFYQTFARPQEVHAAIGSRLESLAARPGTKLARKKEVLDELEELIYHLILAGNVTAAQRIYRERLGGVEHLAQLGEFARGLRILSQFPETFDQDGLFRFRRAVGDVPSEAEWLEAGPHLTWYSSLGAETSLLLTGCLPRCSFSAANYLRGMPGSVLFSEDYAPRFSAILMSKDSSDLVDLTSHPIYLSNDGTIWTRKEVEDLFTRGSFFRKRAAGVLLPWLKENYREVNTWLPRKRSNDYRNMSVSLLWTAEVARMESRREEAWNAVSLAAEWILNASSYEHLCILHLVRARLHNDAGEFDRASVECDEGEILAARARFRLLHVDLLLERARGFLVARDWPTAAAAAMQAREISSQADCQYAWGEALAEYFHCAAQNHVGHPADKPGKCLLAIRRLQRLPRSQFISKYLGFNPWAFRVP